MGRFGVISLLAGAALLGAVLPWIDLGGASAGLARLWFAGLLPGLAMGSFLLIFKRRGARGWLLSAALWLACFPLWMVFASPDKLLVAMAVRSASSPTMPPRPRSVIRRARL